MALTDTTIRNLKPGEKIRKISDSGGLQLHVLPSGSKLWRYAFRYGGKQKTLTIGKYPETGLQQARRRHRDARLLVDDGIDPSNQRREQKRQRQEVLGNTFGLIAEELVEKRPVN